MNKSITSSIENRVAVINAAGKLTALGGSAQSQDVAQAMAAAAMSHVDLKLLRDLSGKVIAELTGADAACVTTGAASGITIGIAAILTGTDFDKVQRLPDFSGENRFLLQAGHAVNFGATVEQMIRLGGGKPSIIGTTNLVSRKNLEDALTGDSYAGFVFVKSHHCVQENMLDLNTCVELCHRHKIPVLVDAAAEEDLKKYVASGAELVTYSGGKAFSGPTSGFISGNKHLIEACELQFSGIARTMKVGKEQIMALITALHNYTHQEIDTRNEDLNKINSLLVNILKEVPVLRVELREDEAGRGFSRIAVSAKEESFDIRDLVKFLASGSPSIRTRNHHINKGLIQIDPREIDLKKAEIIAARIIEFTQQPRSLQSLNTQDV